MDATKTINTAGELIITEGRGQNAISIFYLIFMFIPFINLYSLGSSTGSNLLKIVSIVVIILLIIVLISTIKKVINPEILLIVNEKGITDNISGLAVGFIPWEDIKEVYISRNDRIFFVSLEITDLDKRIEYLSSFKKKIININRGIGNEIDAINLSVVRLKLSPQELFLKMREIAGEDRYHIFNGKEVRFIKI